MCKLETFIRNALFKIFKLSIMGTKAIEVAQPGRASREKRFCLISDMAEDHGVEGSNPSLPNFLYFSIFPH